MTDTNGAIDAIRNGLDADQDSADQVDENESASEFAFQKGGTWALDGPAKVHAIWGRDDEVLWAAGQSCYIVGPTGVGKTTIGSQLVFARLGLRDDFLGYPVENSAGKVLVLASDRPKQAQGVYHRLARPADRDLLDDRLVVWQGPPPRDLAREPHVLAQMCQAADADTVLLDSVMNMAVGLSEDPPAMGLNQAVQLAIEQGTEVVAFHHPTKAGSSFEGDPTIEMVFGSVFLTANTGSVLFLKGRPGATDIQVFHLKQPVDLVGPLYVHHDHATGQSVITAKKNLISVVEQLGGTKGLTATEVAREVLGVSTPSDSQRKKFKRDLDKLVERNELVCVKAPAGGAGGSEGDRYLWFIPQS